MSDKKFDVLLIYNMKEGAKVEIIASRLIDLGLRVWFDQWQIVPGSLWTKEIENAISQTKIICICIGSNGLAESTKKELLNILSKKESDEESLIESLIIPILLPGSSPEDIPSELKDLHIADLRNDINNLESLQYFVKSIQRPKADKITNYNQSNQEANGSQTNTLENNSPIILSGQFQGPACFNSSTELITHPIPCQIPPPPLDFKGRSDELRDIMINFDRGATIVALRGMGGIGKTALALMLAYRLKDRFPDGQFLIDLRGTSDIPLTPAEAMAHVIRVYFPSAPLPEAHSELRGLYLSVLASKRSLILLENAASREQIELLLPPIGCATIITSRRKFGLPGMNVVDLDALPPADARDLLLAIEERIGNHADELAKLCGYLPLALRNAAGVLRERNDIDTAEYVRRLKDARTRLDLVEASFSLSYDLLAPSIQELWCALSVFPADFDCAGAAAVWEIELDAAAKFLGELVKWSLVDGIPSATVENNLVGQRYRLHDLAQLFASSHLDSAARAVAQQKHAEHYKDTLSTANELYLQGGKKIVTGLELFDREWANIQAGQTWAKGVMTKLATQTNPTGLSIDHEFTLRLSSTYPNAGADVLDLRLHPRERIRWLESALVTARLVKDRESEGNTLRNIGKAYFDLSEACKAVEFYEQALKIDKEIKNRYGEATALRNLGSAYLDLSETHKAIEFYEKALMIDREIRDRRGEGKDFGNMGIAYKNLGEISKAIESYEKALTISREIGDRRGEGIVLGNMGTTYSLLGDTRKAVEFYEKALTISREIGDRRGEGIVLGNLGNVHLVLGEIRKAIESYEKALTIDRETGDKRGESANLHNMGVANMILGKIHKAIEFYEQALSIAREIGDRNLEGDTLANMSLALDKIGDRTKAINDLKSAIRIYETIERPNIETIQRRLVEWQQESQNANHLKFRN